VSCAPNAVLTRVDWPEPPVALITAASPGFTVMAPLVPVMLAVERSVAVIVCAAVVFRVALNVPVPLVKVESAGNTALPSVPAKCTVPV